MRIASFALMLGLAVMAQPGESIYLGQCAICHGERGEGGRGPTLRNAPEDEALTRIIRRGIPNSGMPGTGLADGELRPLIAHLRTLGRLAPAATQGDADEGARLYNGKGGCAACHTLNGRGGAFGPDLTGIGGKRSFSHLRTSLTDPATDLPVGFALIRVVLDDGHAATADGRAVSTDGRVVTSVGRTANIDGRTKSSDGRAVTTVGRAATTDGHAVTSDGRAVSTDGRAVATDGDGRVVTGVRVNEDTFSLQLRDAGGTLHSFWKSELRDWNRLVGPSPMPSYRNTLSERDLDNVAAFLTQSR